MADRRKRDTVTIVMVFFFIKKIHPMSKKIIDKYTQWVYNIIVAREQRERS